MKQSNKLLITIVACLITTTAIAHDNAHSHSDGNQKTITEKHHKENKISIKEPWIRSTAPGAPTTAAYFTLLNTTNEDITLTNVKSDIAKQVEIHEHTMNDGIMKMQKVSGVLVPKQSSITFKSGGYHIMFIGLKKSVDEGEKINITLEFDNGTKKVIETNAKKKAEKSKHKHHEHHEHH